MERYVHDPAATLAPMTQQTPLRSVALPIALIALQAASGCSFSASSESISNSISSPFRSSSASSASDASRYRQEVADYAQAFVAGGGGDALSFQRGLATLAEKRGISDWQANPDTWTNLGVGLGRTKISDAAFTGYVESWAGDDATRRDLMRQGFKSAR